MVKFMCLDIRNNKIKTRGIGSLKKLERLLGRVKSIPSIKMRINERFDFLFLNLEKVIILC